MFTLTAYPNISVAWFWALWQQCPTLCAYFCINNAAVYTCVSLQVPVFVPERREMDKVRTDKLTGSIWAQSCCKNLYVGPASDHTFTWMHRPTNLGDSRHMAADPPDAMDPLSPSFIPPGTQEAHLLIFFFHLLIFADKKKIYSIWFSFLWRNYFFFLLGIFIGLF